MRNNTFRTRIYYIIILSLMSFQFANAQNGIVKSYYPDGTVQSEASYVNDVLDGAMITYFSNGKIHTEKNYSRGILEGYVREYFEDGLMKEEYFVKAGVKDGSYRKYSEGGQLMELISYAEGKLTSRQIFDTGLEDKIRIDTPIVLKSTDTIRKVEKQAQDIRENILPEKKIVEKKDEALLLNKKIGEKKVENPSLINEPVETRAEIIPENEEPEILCDVQICPIPIGGFKTIQKNLVYPEHALRYGLEGTVTIIATITAQGDVIKTQVLKGLGLGCSEAAQDVIRRTKFIPGKSNGTTIETNATIEVEFRIFEKK